MYIVEKKCIVKFWIIGPEKNKTSGPDYFLSVLFVTWPLLGKIYISPVQKQKKRVKFALGDDDYVVNAI